jgi:hypothetical protein
LKKKILISVGAVAAFLAALALYVGIPVRSELRAAQSILSGSFEDITAEQIDTASEHLENANARLTGPAPGILRLLPIARQNLSAVDSIVDAGIPVLKEAQGLRGSLDDLAEGSLIESGRVRLDLVESLGDPVGNQVDALMTLSNALETSKSGWLLPPVWDAVSEFASRASDLTTSAKRAQSALDIAGPMLGAEGTRTYLVILVNNAELRGAGGILSGLGTFSVRDGDLSLGRFYYHGRLAEDPPRRVPAPPDFEERFARYFANSTEWVNATASPDVPDVALVASRLFELTTNQPTDGAIVVDPRGLSALLPPDAEIRLSGGGAILAQDLSQYVYSDSYERTGSKHGRRRQAVLQLGAEAFKTIIEGNLANKSTLEAAGAAVAGQHLRIVSFDDNEQTILTELGVSGELSTDATDKVLVTVQNLGGDKLDFWMRRSVRHSCEIQTEESAHCTTSVNLQNIAPTGLPSYVVQQTKAYGHYFGYLEVYLPAAAELTGVMMENEAVEFYREQEEEWTSAGIYFDIKRSKSLSARVSYELPLDGAYSLAIVPQPLTHDADIDVSIAIPDDWQIQTGGSTSTGKLEYEGILDKTLTWKAAPIERRGLSALWGSLIRFWNEPLF